jgi:hypothetical protein
MAGPNSPDLPVLILFTSDIVPTKHGLHFALDFEPCFANGTYRCDESKGLSLSKRILLPGVWPPQWDLSPGQLLLWVPDYTPCRETHLPTLSVADDALCVVVQLCPGSVIPICPFSHCSRHTASSLLNSHLSTFALAHPSVLCPAVSFSSLVSQHNCLRGQGALGPIKNTWGRTALTGL